MFAVPRSCARCSTTFHRRSLASSAVRLVPPPSPSSPSPRRRPSPTSTATPAELLQRHPAFAQQQGHAPTTAPKAPPKPRQRQASRWKSTPVAAAAAPTRRTYREPPLVERARQKTVGQRSIWESYLVLPWNVRLSLWLGIAAFATVGLYAGDYLYPVEEGKLDQALAAEATSSRTLGTQSGGTGTRADV